ncbi:oxygenase MpaB family protein [Solirubrobacter soli]|uniref:oxygenase MpaB family protein n=1 Tax=Solirubrobacter soli TaxID=363832 RepID=UPI000424FE6F|nr:oxygenase MpaB family protein [Solirubrobacter soli]
MEHYFDDHSLLRQVVGHRLTGLSGPRALLVMAAHPVAFAGFFAHTGALDDPYARLRRTATVLDAIAFDTKAHADRLTARVRAMHRTVSGELAEAAGPFAAGTPYRADDPKLLLWILAALAESAMLVYGRYVRSLSHDELDSLWADYRVVGRQFGLREGDMPRDIDDFRDYMHDMYSGGELYVTPAARELAIDIVMSPPVPLRHRPLVELVNQITIGWLPGDVRRQYGFRWDPVRAVALRGGALYVKRATGLLGRAGIELRQPGRSPAPA